MMRGKIGNFLFGGAFAARWLALGLSAALIGCVAPPPDPDEEIAEVSDELDEETEAPDSDGVDEEPGAEDAPTSDPDYLPETSGNPSSPGDERFEPQPVPWIPPGKCDPTSTSDTTKALSRDH